MATEDELPKELGKLEITHVLPQIKLLDRNLPVQMNPFFDDEIKDAVTNHKVEETASTIKFFTNKTANQNCRRCRYRRASESVLDELKHTSPNSTVAAECARTSGVIRQTLKKSTSPSVSGATNRKVVLREPVLKALQTCLHPHSNVRRKLLASAAQAKDPTSSEGPLAGKGMSDFRDLIDECRNLLSEDVDFSGRLNQLCLSNRNSKNFTTMQTPKIPINNKSRNNINPLLNMSTLSLPLPETKALNADEINANTMSLTQHPLPSSNNISLANVQQRNINISSPEQITNPARCSTTCSQQAVNSAAAAASDDVTIDELACYFDTFVHIPKKMSTMAEMMYI